MIKFKEPPLILLLIALPLYLGGHALARIWWAREMRAINKSVANK